jgi:hypothetical protein
MCMPALQTLLVSKRARWNRRIHHAVWKDYLSALLGFPAQLPIICWSHKNRQSSSPIQTRQYTFGRRIAAVACYWLARTVAYGS